MGPPNAEPRDQASRQPADRAPCGNPGPGWSYEEAFSRNRGLVSPEEQQRLRKSRVAVAGLGGVGGVDLVTLARLGVGRFTIADPDVFEPVNFNRQYGAACSTLGHSKVDVMGQLVRDINPEAEIRPFKETIGPNNVASFLENADVLVDGIDAFEIGVRRVLFGAARRLGIHALGAGPVGFSTVWIVFAPEGMSFDRYFDLADHQDVTEQFAAYLIGMAPKATHRTYMDMRFVEVGSGRAPSASLACQLAAGVVGAEVLKILLGRGPLFPAPYYHQFDAYFGRFIRGRLRGGNRHPLQRIKRRWLTRYLKQESQ